MSVEKRNKKKNPFNKKELSIAALLSLALCLGGVAGYAISREKFSGPCAGGDTCKQQNEITYKTFSSDKADFTFKYPVEWTYKEIQDAAVPGVSKWIFYANSQQSDENRIMEAGNLTEADDFFSGAGKLGGETGIKIPYWVRTYLTNDTETFVTQENIDNENKHSGHIYWQKGKYFTNSDSLNKTYDNTTHVISYYNSFLPGSQHPTSENLKRGYEISQYIAKSITIK